MATGFVEDWQGTPFNRGTSVQVGSDEVSTLVQTRLAEMATLADNAWNNAINTLTNVGNYDFSIDEIDIDDILATAGVTPTAPDIVTDDWWDFKESLLNKLSNDLANGGTGLDPTIEEALWERATTRLDDDLDASLILIDTDFSSRGFDMPPAMMAALRKEAIADNNKRKTDLDTDITYKQADMAKEHEQFIIKSGLNKEQLIINGKMQKYATQIQQYKTILDIALENAKINVQSQINTKDLAVTAMERTAQVSQQLAASALAAVNTSVGWDYSGSYSGKVSWNMGWHYNESQRRDNNFNVSASADDLA